MALKDPSSYVLKPQREGGGKSSIVTYLVIAYVFTLFNVEATNRPIHIH